MTMEQTLSPFVLDVSDLSVEIDGREGRVIRPARRLSFRVGRGRVVGVIGESGCGKSMTALSILRLLPTAARIAGGQVLFDGVDLLKKTPRQMREIRGRSIGMVLQDPSVSLDPLFTIGDQIDEALAVHGKMPAAERRARAIELLKAVGIPSPADRLEQYPHELSGGMLQRVVAAIAIAWNPALLIADEPTTALDPTIQVQVLDLLRDLRDTLGVSIMIITHDFGVAAYICDDIMVMYAGEVVETGPVRQIFDKPGHPYTRALMQSSSVPEGDGRLPTIDGQPPDLGALPRGCAFAPRCVLATEQCRQEAPPMYALSDIHSAACWRAGEVTP
ncbi:ABC transporter ATP-binding protein [uncultured Maritimibacter sp.]|jgi:oligopeptide/dipeptide ABC transporter ATP-binding protein|uniref:ABC transporter ATP-binding protein n=1 Tax=uncultured Maritimibacter sp. TaxID=991866 RepID=UPI000A478315|nr:ABC transporter ATP-binding protein [uncultured Maritimibacter sp.]